MTSYQTQFGSLKSHQRGRVEPIQDLVENYAFSNVFEICDASTAYERIVFGINQEYVLEAVRAEGESPWFTCAHDEFALCMDGEVVVELLQPNAAEAAENTLGARLLGAAPAGSPMGWMRLARGHQGLLPARAAYRFVASRASVLVLQTCKGELSIERWDEICRRSADMPHTVETERSEP